MNMAVLIDKPTVLNCLREVAFIRIMAETRLNNRDINTGKKITKFWNRDSLVLNFSKKRIEKNIGERNKNVPAINFDFTIP